MLKEDKSIRYLILFLILAFMAGIALAEPQSLKKANNCKAEKNESVIINGDSMSPLFKNKQEVLLDLNFYSCHEIQVNDVVVFEIPGRKNRIIKKVFGLPGDRFEYKNQNILINGKVLKNSMNEAFSINSKMLELYSKSYPIIPVDSFLVLGDQPHGSFDASKMGFIERKQILGKIRIP